MNVWIAPATREQLAEGLFHFLAALAAGRPDAPRPLIAEDAVLRALYRDPPAELVDALRRFLDGFFLDIDPDLTGGRTLDLDPSVWGWVLAVYNSLVPPLEAGGGEDPLAEFHQALVATLPAARTTDQVLACYALLDTPATALAVLSPERAAVIETLLRLSPLSAMAHLDVSTPPVLLELPREPVPDPAPWRDLDDWLGTLLPLLANPGVARHLRQRWLALPETLRSCRNLGHVLEALRVRGWRDFVLELYEAYDYFAAVPAEDAWGRRVRTWPVLERIAWLLAAGGTSEAAFRLNQWGTAYLLKFRPLVEIVIAEGGIPRDYRHLSRELLVALRPLLRLMPEGVEAAVELEEVEFGEEEYGAVA